MHIGACMYAHVCRRMYVGTGTWCTRTCIPYISLRDKPSYVWKHRTTFGQREGVGHFFWRGSGPHAVHLSPPENLKNFYPDPIGPLFDLEPTKKFCAKIVSVTPKSKDFFHEKNRLGKCAIFLYVDMSRELAVKFFDLAFLVPTGLGHMQIHPLTCQTAKYINCRPQRPRKHEDTREPRVWKTYTYETQRFIQREKTYF